MDFLAVCLVRAIVDDVESVCCGGVLNSGCLMQEEKTGNFGGGGSALIPLASWPQLGRLI